MERPFGRDSPELGGLSNLGYLYLHGNDFSGPIPPELGDLASLVRLWLQENDLTGAIPPELGGLSNLNHLYLGQNDLSGPIPPTFGGLASLTELELSHNAGLAGAMPAGLRNLSLESLVAGGTELCVPREPAFEEWLATIPRRRIAVCGEPPAAYLVQAVQSRTHPVPLVAGEDALLRVFVTAAMETTEGIPDVRARFYLNGTERHVAEIAAASTPIPTEIDEGDLAMSANAEIPGWLVQPGLEMVVEIDPDGVLDPSLGVASRIPQEGRLAVEVREMPVLDLTVIPFLWSSDPDSAIIGLVEGMAADPEGHSLLEDTHVLLPVAGLDVTARAPVASTSNNVFNLLAQTEGGPRAGGRGRPLHGDDVGRCDGWCRRSRLPVRPIELLAAVLRDRSPRAWAQHGPPARPVRGRTGTGPVVPVSVRNDRRLGVRLPPRPPGAGDAEGPHDILRSRLDQRLPLHQRAQPPLGRRGHVGRGARRLGQVPAALGRRQHDGHPFPQPPPSSRTPRPRCPTSAGDYIVTGRDASGRDLFSFSFAMPVALSEEAEASSFVFALPAQPGWADALASVTLSGPAGTATLDGSSDTSMAHPAQPCYGPGAGLPARRGGSRGGRARAVGGWDGHPLQPRHPRLRSLETLTLRNHGIRHQQPPGRSGPPQRPHDPPTTPLPRVSSTTPTNRSRHSPSLLALPILATPLAAQHERTFRPLRSLGAGSELTASISLADVNGDGALDAIVANGRHWPGQNRIYLNDGSGHFKPGPTFGSPSSTRSLTLADLDGDGHTDILVVNRWRQNFIFHGNGPGGFGAGIPFGSGDDSTIDVAAADLDADLDLVLANRDGGPNAIHWNDAGSFARTTAYGTGTDETRGAAVGDLDGDGHPDIVTANIGEPNAVYYGDGAGNFERSRPFAPSDDQSYAVRLADLDLDGDLDIVVANVAAQNAVYFNRGTEAHDFDEFRFGCQDCATYGVAVGDLNGDGFPEIHHREFRGAQRPLRERADSALKPDHPPTLNKPPE